MILEVIVSQFVNTILYNIKEIIIDNCQLFVIYCISPRIYNGILLYYYLKTSNILLNYHIKNTLKPKQTSTIISMHKCKSLKMSN